MYKSGGSISFCRRCWCGGESLLDDDSTPNTPDTCSALLIYIYTYLFHAYGGTTAPKPLDSKYTLVIGGCGKECEVVCLAPTFRVGDLSILDSDTREV